MNTRHEPDLTVPHFSEESWGRRVVLPEALDALEPDDERAVRSRAELDVVNVLMGNHAWLLRRLKEVHEPGMRVLEIGAGSGALAEKLVDRGIWERGNVMGMDVMATPPRWPAGATWVEGDVLDDPLPDAEVVISNLLLHQFTDAQVSEFALRLPPSCRCLLVVEPLRSRMSLWMGHAVTWLGCMQRLTVHDMVLSVHAGFRGEELPQAMNLPHWSSEVRETCRGGYRVVMEKQSGVE